MKVRNAYSGKITSGCMLRFLYRCLILYTLFLVTPPSIVFSQDLPEYDEIAVFLEIPGIGGGEIDAVIRDEDLYLPVTDLFDFLKIRNIPSPGLETISGSFIDPEAKYEINRQDNLIIYKDKTFNLNPGDLIHTESNLYLLTSYFGEVFGLECKFSFRSLSVTVNSKLELPLIREMRLEEMRRNLTRLKGEVKADTNIGRTYPLFKFGMADWSAIATEEINGESETRLSLNLGTMIAKGEMTAALYYNSADPVTEKQQNYLWRYVNNNFKSLRQVMAGKIATNSISSIYNPVIGVQVTNTPTTYRRSFGTYSLSDRTEPNWIVELYVNNVLVDYKNADASGFFTFEVPLVYGNSIVKLKFYSPWGEERTREQNINIPFNFLPPKTLEYTVGTGIVEDSLMSRFSRAGVNYGLTKSLTIGAGTEYLSSVTSGQYIPFLMASFRLTNNILLYGEYDYGVRAKGTFTYRMPSNLQFDLNYTWYDKDQKAIYYNYREERKATLSMPVRIGKFSSYQRFSYYQIVLPYSNYTTAEWLCSASVLGINTNITTYGLFIENLRPNIYSNLSMTFRLPANFILMPQAQYSYTGNGFISAKIRIEKPLLDHAHLNFSYEQNFMNSISLAEMGFRYDFSFAQLGTSVRQLNKKTSFVQYARGSLINDRQTKYLHADNRTNVGRGGISIVPYLDLNSNGKREPGEPKVYGLNIHTNGGRIEKSERDTTIRILGLEPYTNCFIELDPNSFDNIAWRLEKKTMSVAVDPNILKLIEIPVIIAGEATGSVELDQDGAREGIGRIIVSFFTSTGKPAGKVLSEEDGYFSFLGLSPGGYLVRIDTSQLRKLGMEADPDSLSFNVAGGIEGDIVEGLDFILRKKTLDSIRIINVGEPGKPFTWKDTSYMIIHEVVEELVTITEDSWAIQLGAFEVRSNAEDYRKTLEKILGKKVDIVIEGGFFKVRIPGLKTRDEVDRDIEVLRKNGVTELWVIRPIEKRQQLILKEKQDTIVKITEISTEPAVALRVGIYHKKNQALRARKIITSKLNLPVDIVLQWNYYHVLVTGFYTRDEAYKFFPKLAGIGYPGVTVIENYKKEK